MDHPLFRVLLTTTHLLVLGFALFLLRAIQRHLLRSSDEHGAKCPTYLAAIGEYQAPPRGWLLVHLFLRLLLPRVALAVAGVGLYLIAIQDLGLKPVFAKCFTGAGWEWKLPTLFSIGIGINLVATIARYCSLRLRQAAMKDIGQTRAILLLVGAQALQALLPIVFAFFAIPMLGMPLDAELFIKRCTLVLVIIFVGIASLRILNLVEAKIKQRAKIRHGSDARRVQAVETQYSVMHRLLAAVIVIATAGAVLMIFDNVRAFGASLLTSAGIVGLVAGIAAQRTLQNVFAGLQLAVTQPITIGDVVEVENTMGTIEEIGFSFVTVQLTDLRRLILPVTYFLERPFTNWTRTSAESMTSFALVLALNSPLNVIRQKLDEVLLNNPLWNGRTKEVMISELGESSMVVRITLSAADPHTALRLKSQVQEELLRFLNQLKDSVLLGAVPEQEIQETTSLMNPQTKPAVLDSAPATRVVGRSN